jgi:hypothetical protein
MHAYQLVLPINVLYPRFYPRCHRHDSLLGCHGRAGCDEKRRQRIVVAPGTLTFTPRTPASCDAGVFHPTILVSSASVLYYCTLCRLTYTHQLKVA